ncbi:unnamed protein product [Calypogeia fissa]
MKDSKFASKGFKGWGLSTIHKPRGVSGKKPFKIIGIVVFALLMMCMLLGPGTIDDIPQSNSDEVGKVRSYEKAISSSPQSAIAAKRNTTFSFLPRVIDLDARRKSWLEQNPDVRAGRPSVLIVTGSRPSPCENPVDTHMYLKAAKNKVHYSRMHDLQMYYNLMEPHKNVVGSWTKLPVLRMQMVAHPEVEWLWWMDSDLVITDMEFKLPVDKYDGYNLVVFGDEHRVLELKDWKGLGTGNFLIRNCQWSLDLLDAWAEMGDVKQRDKFRKVLSDYLQNRPQNMEADDQSALVYLLSTEKALWSPKTFLETDIYFTVDWTSVTEELEVIEGYGRGDPRWPVATHFTGCSRCGGREGAYPWEKCLREMQRAMDFADNQVYRRYGYELRGLGINELVPISGHVPENVVASPDGSLGEYKGFTIHKLPGPNVENWDDQRVAWFKKNPHVKKVNDHALPKTMIVTGSSTKECTHPVGGHGLLQALKNKVDYGRFHDMPIFYGQVDFDKSLDYWWTKIPTIRVLMLSHPDVEWFWWCDGDAAVTDMVFTPPYELFKGQNLVLYGNPDLLAVNDWVAVNAGIYLVRNCQWTLDLFDVWASLGTKQARGESGRRASELLVGRGVADADDQSALLYMLVNEKEEKEKKWTPRIWLEREFTVSGNWESIVYRYESMSIADKGTGDKNWPWITHFAGCQPCGDRYGNSDVDECRTQLRRAFDFADNQVIEQYRLVHSPLGNPEVTELKPSRVK